MSLKSVFHERLGHAVKFGRLPMRPSQHNALPKLAKYMVPRKLPTPPSALDLRSPAMSVLRNVELNNEYGCCVIAAKAHIDGVWTGNAGRLFATTTDEIIVQYSAIGGFDPKNPTATDNGCNMQDAIAWWAANDGADGTKILGGVSVDATNIDEIKLALSLFENGFIGIGLPDAWVNAMGSISDNTVWDVSGPSDPNNGHCIPMVAYNADGIIVDTWGDFVLITWKALAAYAVATSGGEFDILISRDMLIKGQDVAPNGIDWETLVADANTIFGGAFPVPTPAPGPTPAPAPVTPPPVAPPVSPDAMMTVESALTAVQMAFSDYPLGLLTRNQAVDVAQRAIISAANATVKA